MVAEYDILPFSSHERTSTDSMMRLGPTDWPNARPEANNSKELILIKRFMIKKFSLEIV